MRLHTRLLSGAIAISLLIQLAACGTIFYPERRGQISGQIDPAVAGAIYLPGGKHAQVDPQLLQKAVNPDGSIDNLRLKAIIEEQTGQQLPLDNPYLIQQRGSLQQLASLGLQPAA